jgi:hypothetical protein
MMASRLKTSMPLSDEATAIKGMISHLFLTGTLF